MMGDDPRRLIEGTYVEQYVLIDREMQDTMFCSGWVVFKFVHKGMF